MVFHIGLRLWLGADAKLLGDEPILLVKRSAVPIDLKREQPNMFRRLAFCKI
jgi:hypothetical protein